MKVLAEVIGLLLCVIGFCTVFFFVFDTWARWSLDRARKKKERAAVDWDTRLQELQTLVADAKKEADRFLGVSAPSG